MPWHFSIKLQTAHGKFPRRTSHEYRPERKGVDSIGILARQSKDKGAEL